MRLDERLRQATPVELDKPRKLLVTLNALYEIEEVTGNSVLSPGDWGKPTAKSLFVMLAAFCRHEDPEVTVAQIAKAFNTRRMPEMMSAISTAWKKNAAGTPADGTVPAGGDANFPEASPVAVLA